MLKKDKPQTSALKSPSHYDHGTALNENAPASERKLVTVKQMLTLKKYGWATESFLRHAIFQAEDRLGTGGAVVPGNGLAPAILRIWAHASLPDQVSVSLARTFTLTRCAVSLN
ncbi:hypothetical protein ACFMBG_01245 [Leisingera sp. D0M16]|uniref:hypothetical protein n=1 Tax=Leisingera coralii TaxID=3351347 RepID=UPI003B78CE7B